MGFSYDDKPSVNREKDVEYDTQSIIDDTESDSATKFNPDDAEIGVHMSDGAGQDRWHQLKKLNAGIRDSESASRRNTQQKVDDVVLIATECDLTNRQIETAERLVTEVDTRTVGRYTTVEDVVFATVCIVSFEDQPVKNMDRFQEYVDDWGSDRETIETIMPKIEQQLGIGK